MEETLSPLYGLVPVFLFCGTFFLVFIWITIENLIFNIKMGKIWKTQEYGYPDLQECPKCGFPQIYGRMVCEGMPLNRKYYQEEFKCNHCGEKFKFVVKWNGFNGDPQ